MAIVSNIPLREPSRVARHDPHVRCRTISESAGASPEKNAG